VTTPHLAGHPAASQQAIVDAALLMLQQMGLSPGDLMTAPRNRPPVPTFAEYVPVVSAAVTDGTRRAYGSYWNRVIAHWGERQREEQAWELVADGWLALNSAAELLGCSGVPLAEGTAVTTECSLIAAAARIGGSVAAPTGKGGRSVGAQPLLRGQPVRLSGPACGGRDNLKPRSRSCEKLPAAITLPDLASGSDDTPDARHHLARRPHPVAVPALLPQPGDLDQPGLRWHQYRAAPPQSGERFPAQLRAPPREPW
jgi:hypothetical protein